MVSTIGIELECGLILGVVCQHSEPHGKIGQKLYRYYTERTQVEALIGLGNIYQLKDTVEGTIPVYEPSRGHWRCYETEAGKVYPTREMAQRYVAPFFFLFATSERCWFWSNDVNETLRVLTPEAWAGVPVL